MDYAQLSFTPALSKKIIAKGVAALPWVQSAFNHGKILVSAGTTTAHIYVELTGSLPDKALACGMVTAKGPCVGQAMTEFIGIHNHARFWFFDQGQLIEAEDLEQVMEQLSAGDVFMKSANAIDGHGQAGVMLGMESGGTIGKAIGHVMAKGVQFIIPVGLEKTVLGSVSEIAKEMGIGRLTHSSGMPVGLIPVSGKTITEIEALKQLADVEVIHVASGGILGGEGSVTLLVKGEKEEVEKVISIYSEIREDDRLDKIVTGSALCHEHKWPHCIRKNIFFKNNVKQRI